MGLFFFRFASTSSRNPKENHPPRFEDLLAMSDVEVDDAPMAAAAAAVAAAPMDIQKAIQEVLKESLIHDGLARGLREATQSLDKRQAIACILAENCDEENY